MQRSGKPARPKGAPRTYILEVNGAKRAATRTDFAFSWHDRIAPDDPSIAEPLAVTLNGKRYKAVLRGGVLRWEPVPAAVPDEDAPVGGR